MTMRTVISSHRTTGTSLIIVVRLHTFKTAALLRSVLAKTFHLHRMVRMVRWSILAWVLWDGLLSIPFPYSILYQNRRFKVLKSGPPKVNPLSMVNRRWGVFDEDTWNMDSAEDSIDSQPRRSTRKATSNPPRVNIRHPCPLR